MQFIYFCAFATVVCAVNARRLNYNDNNMPIRLVDTSYGQGDHERIDYLEAVIRPNHVNTNGRLNFPTSGHLNDYFMEAKADGDERGHLVASQFSGPADWYNLSPQNPRVNRNVDYQAINTDWYGAECEVRNFLNAGGDRYVKWNVRMKYVRDSNRPDEYHLTVNFIVNGKDNKRGIDTRIRNPFLKEDSTFTVCRGCGANHHGPNSQCTRQ